MVVTAFINIIDYKTDFLNLNPPDQINQKFIIFNYPDLGYANDLMHDENGTITNLPLMTIEIVLQYQGILAEGSKVDVYAVGFIHHNENFVQKVRVNDSVVANVAVVGFENAIPYNKSDWPNFVSSGQIPIFLEYQPTPTAYLPDTTMPPRLMRESITWNSQGDYSPFITFLYYNGTDATVITQDYPEQKIHVSGSDIVRQEKYSRINTWITIALFVFTTITILQLLVYLIPKRYLAWFLSEDGDSHAENKPPAQTEPESPLKK